MNTLAPSFLIRSSSFLQVTRTYIKAWMSSNFGKFANRVTALDRRQNLVFAQYLENELTD